MTESIERAASKSSQHSPTNTSFGFINKNLPLIPAQADPAHRTLEDVRLQAANEVAVRAITHSEIVDGVRLGVALSLPQKEEDNYLEKIADLIASQLSSGTYLFAVGAAGPATENGTPLVFVGSNKDYVARAKILASSKFIGRFRNVYTEDKRWHVHITGLGTSLRDEDALWHVLRKATALKTNPAVPPPGSRGIEEILEDARTKLIRVTPEQAHTELRELKPEAPVFLVDIRPVAQRQRDGEIPGALVIERNVLEWRLDPRHYARLPIADRYDLRVIVFCDEGYTSSLAAFALQELGLSNATDMIGGIQAWKAAGLPTEPILPKSPFSLDGSLA